MSAKLDHNRLNARLSARGSPEDRHVGLVIAATASIEAISECEAIISLIDSWPEIAALEHVIVRRAKTVATLAFVRNGGHLTFEHEKTIGRTLMFYQSCRKHKKLPPPPDPTKRKPMARYRRSPLASFLTDPTTLPKAPPRRNTP